MVRREKMNLDPNPAADVPPKRLSFVSLRSLPKKKKWRSIFFSFSTMGRRRNTAKTGDKALYKKRDDLGSNQRRESDDDPVYDAVDRFHKDEEFIQLSREEQGDDSHDEIDRTEAVMDLGLAGESSSSEEEDDDKSDSEEENVHVPGQDRSLGLGDDLDDEEASLSSDDSDQEIPLKTNVRDWGRQKKDYYHGDTADLELGQEEDDAFVEEQAAKEIQAARYQQMTEDDFALSDDEEDHDDDDDDDGRKPEESGLAKPGRELSKLSRSEKAKLLDRQHPELLPLVSHFSQILRDWNEETNVVTSALFEGEDGTSEVSSVYHIHTHSNVKVPNRDFASRTLG